MILSDVLSFGGGGEGAVIKCTGDVLSTDSVVATKGSKTINGVWVTDHFEIKNINEYGIWTVTATRGSISCSKSVLVDTLEEYDIDWDWFPSGEYTEYDYIQTSGTQYVDLGIKGNLNTRIELVFTPNVNSFCTVVGDRTSATEANIEVNTTQGNIQVDFGDYSTTRLDVSITTTSNTFTVYTNKDYRRIVTSDGTTYSQSTVYSTSFETPNNIQLFRNIQRSDWEKYTGKLRKLKIWDGDTLLINLKPCKRNSDNVVGLFNTVSQTLFTNDGTGSFVGGDD